MVRKLLPWALVVMMCPAWALNMNGFKDAPITRLSQDELKAFRAAVMKALDETPDGATIEWKASKTSFVSKVTPRKSFADGKRPCREAIIESDAGDRYQRGVYTFCKQANGEWQFATPAAKPKAK